MKTTLKLHWSLLLLVAAYCWYLRDVDWSYKWLKIITLSVIIIISIFLHELGHAVAFVYAYDIQVNEIVLIALGGATVPAREPTER